MVFPWNDETFFLGRRPAWFIAVFINYNAFRSTSQCFTIVEDFLSNLSMLIYIVCIRFNFPICSYFRASNVYTIKKNLTVPGYKINLLDEFLLKKKKGRKSQRVKKNRTSNFHVLITGPINIARKHAPWNKKYLRDRATGHVRVLLSFFSFSLTFTLNPITCFFSLTIPWLYYDILFSPFLLILSLSLSFLVFFSSFFFSFASIFYAHPFDFNPLSFFTW